MRNDSLNRAFHLELIHNFTNTTDHSKMKIPYFHWFNYCESNFGLVFEQSDFTWGFTICRRAVWSRIPRTLNGLYDQVPALSKYHIYSRKFTLERLTWTYHLKISDQHGESYPRMNPSLDLWCGLLIRVALFGSKVRCPPNSRMMF